MCPFSRRMYQPPRAYTPAGSACRKLDKRATSSNPSAGSGAKRPECPVGDRYRTLMINFRQEVLTGGK
jgi:hypothetical protein